MYVGVSLNACVCVFCFKYDTEENTLGWQGASFVEILCQTIFMLLNSAVKAEFGISFIHFIFIILEFLEAKTLSLRYLMFFL